MCQYTKPILLNNETDTQHYAQEKRDKIHKEKCARLNKYLHNNCQPGFSPRVKKFCKPPEQVSSQRAGKKA